MLGTWLWQSDVAVTTLNGVAPPTMAEYALMMMLAFAHHLPLMLEHQARADFPSLSERWRRFMPRELRGATLGIVGYGSIGRELGRVARALGMRVLGLRRVAVPPPETYMIASVATHGEVPDRLYGPEGLHEMLPHCDYIILIVPYTAATHHLIDRAALHAMKPTAVLVNMARGGIVDEEALIEALRGGRIAGAALDVFEEEPLPSSSPLWAMRNVIISPHIAGFTPHYHERVMELFGANLRRYLAAEPLLNQAQRERGY
jgi:phosphoglycerate dehydrogenase-like enzyme